MRARAPGKLVLSGAYAVLEGAPALVAAVDRYARADSERPPPMITDEVAKAIAMGMIDRAPWFDASALRESTPSGDRKLGLGSSAAILAASIAARLLEEEPDEADLAQKVFPLALSAHRAAQPGGSGVDVAASCMGGVILCRLEGAELRVKPHELPSGTCIEVLACPQSASTQQMLGRVHALRDRDPQRFGALIERASQGARAACEAHDVAALVAALRVQYEALAELGEAAGAPIVLDEVAALDRLARASGGCVGPSGAGGGDVALRFGPKPSDAAFRAAAEASGMTLVPMQIGATGVQRGW